MGAWNDLLETGLQQAARAVLGLESCRTALTGRGARTDDHGGVRGRGPVVLLGGLGETAPLLVPMTRHLEELGYRVTPLTVGAGLDCGARTADEVAGRVARIADEAGEPVRLVGHSRGGMIARAVGRRSPQQVAALVTLGSPFDPGGLRLPMMGLFWGLAAVGTLGIPGLYGLGCLVGECCLEFRDAQRAPWPPDIPFTSIYSRRDLAVPWRSSTDPFALNIEVGGSHLAMMTSTTAHQAVAEALARPVQPAAVAA